MIFSPASCRCLNAQREEVIKRSRFVRRYKDWARVFIDPDRTQKEQEEHKALRIEFKQRQEAGENIIFRKLKNFRQLTTLWRFYSLIRIVAIT
jgi:hypothetical protein